MQSPTAPTHASHLNGKSIKGYELLERIGAGGFGAVYRALQSTINREVAIKIILPGWSSNPEFIRRFEVEAQVIARLEHPHIVPLHDYWRDPSGAYLVMRYLRGGSVRDALCDGPYDLESASQLLDQVASALDFAHRNQVIHRDVKPGNILLDEDGNAYLGDFGIAKDLTGTVESYAPPEGVTGSLDYISPEQARSEPVTAQSDIYSLGVTLYEMITGEHPFAGSSSVEKLFHHINDPLPPILDLDPAVSDDVNALIQIATAKAPARRYPDALALALAFREAIGRGDTEQERQIVEQLTMREHEVLQLIAQGMTNQEIANKLFVTVATVRWHIRQLYKKLGVRSRVQATVRARELDLIVTDAVSEPDGLPSTGTTIVSLPEPDNPYKGLHPFNVSDSADFFGREAFTDKLIERMNDQHRFSRFLAIVGPSGSGKSSLVRAGLIPALWQGKLPGSERWFIVDMIPGTRPLDQLEVALVRVAANQASSLSDQLARDPNGLLRAVDLILPRDATELVLIVDQFEELFTLVESEPTRAQFLALLHAAVTDPRSRVRVVVTLRADYYDRPLHYPEFGEMVLSRMETVLPLSAQGLERAITGPAQRAGVTFEPGLVAQIVSEMHYQAGALPLLQYALTELFDRRSGRLLTRAAYEDIEGAVGALAHRAEEIFYSQSDDGRALTRQVFLRLVTLGDRPEHMRRRVPRSELLALSDDRDLVDEIIDTFADYRLLSLDHEPDTRRPVVEVAHEAILDKWDRLGEWLQESRHDIQQQRRVATAAAEWERAGQESSYLLRGARLDEVERWAAQTSVALTHKERTFLETSLAEQTHEEESERERQAHEVALARRAELSQRQAAQRLRYLVAGLMAFLVAAIGLSLFAFSRQQDADQARATSDTNALRAEDNANQAHELALVNAVQAALAQNDLDTALALAVAANRTDYPSTQAQRVLSEAAYHPGPVRSFEGTQADAMRAEFSPDGTLLLSGGMDNISYVWDVASGQLLHRLTGHTDWVIDVGISPDGRTGFTMGRDRNIIIWDLMTGEELRRFGSDLILGPDMLSATYSPDGRHILSNNGGLPLRHPGEEANLILWDAATGEPVRIFRGHSGGVGSMAISPDGRTALSGASMGEMILWDMATGDVLARFSEPGDDWRRVPSDIVFSPDGRTAYAQGMDGVVVVWDLDTRTARDHLGTAYAVGNWAWNQLAISPDGRWLCEQGNGSATFTLWDAQTGKEVGVIRGRGSAVAFSPDGRYVVTSVSPDLRLWDLMNGAQMQQFEVDQPPFGIALSPDGAVLFAATGAIMGPNPQGCEFHLFDVATGRTEWRVEIPADQTDQLGCILWASPVFSRDGRTILAGVDERVMLWDTASSEHLRTFSGHSGSVTSIAVSLDGRSVLSGDIAGQVILWDMATAQEIRRMGGHSLEVVDGLFLQDGRTALSCGGDGTCTVWDLATGDAVRHFAETGSGVSSVDLSPDGRTLVSYHSSGQIVLWDIATGQVLRSFVSPYGDRTVRFLPDGKHVATNLGELWELSSGDVIRLFPEGSELAISPDGSSLFTSPWSPMPSIVQHRIDSHDELMAWTLANRAVREPTCDERALYQIDPPCNGDGTFPTRTPYPAPLTRTSASATVAAAEIDSGVGRLTPTPTVTPRPVLIARLGENRGDVAIGDVQVWQYEGRAGESLTIQVLADLPANWVTRGDDPQSPVEGVLDTLVIVTAPDGRDLNVYNSGGSLAYLHPQSDDIPLGANTDSLVDGLVLPVDGTYQILVSGSGYRTGGTYTLIIASEAPTLVAPAP